MNCQSTWTASAERSQHFTVISCLHFWPSQREDPWRQGRCAPCSPLPAQSLAQRPNLKKLALHYLTNRRICWEDFDIVTQLRQRCSSFPRYLGVPQHFPTSLSKQNYVISSGHCVVVKVMCVPSSRKLKRKGVAAPCSLIPWNNIGVAIFEKMEPQDGTTWTLKIIT